MTLLAKIRAFNAAHPDMAIGTVADAVACLCALAVLMAGAWFVGVVA